MMNKAVPRISPAQPPSIGTPNSSRATIRIKAVWIMPTMTNGASLPIITSSGCTGVASRLSIVPRSCSRVTPIAVIITRVMVSTTPSRPGTTL
jgi:hypothetical protein